MIQSSDALSNALSNADLNNSSDNENNLNNSKVHSQRSKSLNDDKPNLARTLRRMKRKMFLKAVEQPLRPSDSLREIILKVALEDSPSSSSSFSDVSEALYIITEE